MRPWGLSPACLKPTPTEFLPGIIWHCTSCPTQGKLHIQTCEQGLAGPEPRSPTQTCIGLSRSRSPMPALSVLPPLSIHWWLRFQHASSMENQLAADSPTPPTFSHPKHKLTTGRWPSLQGLGNTESATDWSWPIQRQYAPLGSAPISSLPMRSRGTDRPSHHPRVPHLSPTQRSGPRKPKPRHSELAAAA